MMTRKALALLLAILFTSPAALAQSADKEKKEIILIKAGRLVDLRTGTELINQAILIEGDRIKETAPAQTASSHAPAGAQVIDLGNATVLPGLVDCHTHVTTQPENYYDDLFRKSPIDVAVVAHVYARRTVEAGFTTIRDVGAGEFLDVALRNAINS